jgi:hypothetical protein
MIVLASPVRAGLCANALQRLEPAGSRQTSTGPPKTATRDRVTVHQGSSDLVVDVRRVTGIGRTRLPAPARGWPDVVLVRLHDFSALESFRASASAATLTCEQGRPEGAPATLECRLDDTQLYPVERKPGYYEILLPKTLLEGGGPVEIRWIDQWR